MRNRFQSQRRSPEHRRLIKRGEISLIINTPLGKTSHYDEQAIRKSALQFNVPTVTTMTGAEALIEAIATKKSQEKIDVRSLQEIHNKQEKVFGVK